jgi:hypothetical protein
MLLTTLSAGAIVHSLLLTKLNFWSQGTIKCTLAFKRKISAHNNQHGWKWKMAAARWWHWKIAAAQWR